MFRTAVRNLASPLRRGVYVGCSGSLLIGGGALMHAIQPSQYILNDSIVGVQQRGDLQQELGLPTRSELRTVQGGKGTKVNFRQMCYGSIMGLFFGVIVGKISSLLVFITGVGLLGMQFLQNRGVISSDSTRALSKYAITVGKEKIDLNTLLWDRPSFKVSFLLTFVLAAFNV